MEKRGLVFITGILLGLVSMNLKAQNPNTLIVKSLDSILAIGIQSNPNYSVYKQQTQIALINLKTARSTWFPSISGSLNGQDNTHLATTPIPGVLIGKPGTTYNAQFGTKYNYTTGLTLQKDLLSWQNYLQIKLAKGNLNLTEVQSDAYVQSLKEQIAKLYFSILVAKASLDLGEKNKRIADSLVQIAQNKLDQGNSDALNFNQSKINYNTVIQNIAQSRELYDQGIENLKILLGEKGNRELIIQDQLFTDSGYYFHHQDLKPDKNLETYKQEFINSGLQAQIQKSAFLPKLSFQSYLGASQYRNDFGFSLNSNNWNKVSYLGLNLSVPIFTGFSNLNKFKSAMGQYNLAKTQYESAQNQSFIQDELLLKTDLDLMEMVNASRSGYKLYQKNLELNRQKFNEGIASLDIYLKSFQDYINSENIYLNNLSNFLSNKATLISRQ